MRALPARRGSRCAACWRWRPSRSVPYVPTPQDVVERMLEIAKVGPSDYLIDLGSGDGRIVVTAAKKYGARGFGVDLNPERIRESNENARRAGVTDKVAFYQRNLFETDLSQATVITMYLLPRVNLELRPKLLRAQSPARASCRTISTWATGSRTPTSRWTRQDKYGGAGGTSDIYFWVVPARVAGIWHWQSPVAGKPQSYEIRLEQKYQVITGSASVGGRAVKLQDARLRGDGYPFHLHRRGERLAREARVLRQGRGRRHQRLGAAVGRPHPGAARMERQRGPVATAPARGSAPLCAISARRVPLMRISTCRQSAPRRGSRARC